MKQVVSAVDGSAMGFVALRYGAELARHMGAGMRAVFVKNVKLLDSGAFADQPVHDTLENALAKEAEETLFRATDMMERLGLPLETATRRGVVPLVLVEEAGEADLLTMGRWGEHALWSTGLLGSAVECVVRKVNRPVLVASSPYADPKRVVVAWDGSGYAQKALRFGLQAAVALKLPAVALIVRKPDLDVEALEAQAHAVCTELGAGCSLTVSIHDGKRSAEIASEADPETLTFMGAYGKSPMRNLVLGSVTAMVMRSATGPVVLCR